jgi:hypothetical protein
MIRRYCDRCGEQMGKRRRIKRELWEAGRIVTVEVTVAFNRTWNAGDVCDDCVLLAVNNGLDVSDNTAIPYTTLGP